MWQFQHPHCSSTGGCASLILAFLFLSLCGVNVAFSSVTFWHFLLVFLFSSTSGETPSLSLYPSFPSTLLTRVKLVTRRMIFTLPFNLYSCLLYEGQTLCCFCEVTKEHKNKQVNVTKQKAAALDLRDNWIKGTTVKAMCNQAHPYQQQFSMLCPQSSLSAASRLIKLPRLHHCEWWLTGLR